MNEHALIIGLICVVLFYTTPDNNKVERVFKFVWGALAIMWLLTGAGVFG